MESERVKKAWGFAEDIFKTQRSRLEKETTLKPDRSIETMFRTTAITSK